jgi:hypothetical protein
MFPQPDFICAGCQELIVTRIRPVIGFSALGIDGR